MILAIDIGNTHTVLGIFDRGDEPRHRWRLSTRGDSTGDDLGTLLSELFTLHGLRLGDVAGTVVSSVVPSLSGAVVEVGMKYLGRAPLVVGPGTKTGVPILYDNPREVGADRIVNALAAIRLHGTPAIVVDFGTATTFDAVSAAGEYLGGAIAPGIGVSVEALAKRAARLPEVELSVPRRVIGRNTVESLQSGLVHGYSSLAEGIIVKMAAELGGRCHVIATGGWSEFLSPLIPSVQAVDMDLTLKGLKMIWEMNQPEGGGA
jgi:type III pantothenate kinase